MRDQRLGRLATVNGSGTPHVVPVGFRYNPELGVVDVRGRNPGQTKKFRDLARTGRAGALEGIDRPGSEGALTRIFPERIVGWGIDSDAPGPNARSVPG